MRIPGASEALTSVGYGIGGGAEAYQNALRAAHSAPLEPLPPAPAEQLPGRRHVGWRRGWLARLPLLLGVRGWLARPSSAPR